MRRGEEVAGSYKRRQGKEKKEKKKKEGKRKGWDLSGKVGVRIL